MRTEIIKFLHNLIYMNGVRGGHMGLPSHARLAGEATPPYTEAQVVWADSCLQTDTP